MLKIAEIVKIQPFIGLDCEWNPYGKNAPIALLQIAVYNPADKNFHCYLFQLPQLKNDSRFRSKIQTLMNDEKVFKLGAGIANDYNRLIRDKFCKNKASFLDLKRILTPLEYHKSGIKGSCLNFVGRDMVYKNRKITMSKWDNKNLSEDQIMYAADDALVGLQVLAGLVKKYGADVIYQAFELRKENFSIVKQEKLKWSCDIPSTNSSSEIIDEVKEQFMVRRSEIEDSSEISIYAGYENESESRRIIRIMNSSKPNFDTIKIKRKFLSHSKPIVKLNFTVLENKGVCLSV